MCGSVAEQEVAVPGGAIVALGIDLGGTSIRVGLYDRAMQLLDSHTTATRVADGPQSAVDFR